MSNDPAAKTADTVPALIPATPAAKRAALGLCIAAFVAFGALVPFARVSLPRLEAPVVAGETTFALIFLVTTGFLLLGYRRSRLRAALVLASGYLFAALLSVPRLLTMSGVPSSGGLQASIWLDIFRQGGFPLFVLGYALTKRGERGDKQRPAGAGTVAVAAVAGLAAGIWLLVTAGHRSLPLLVVGDRHTSAMLAAGLAVALINLAALAFLCARRTYTVLELWLIVILCTWLCGNALDTIVGAARFDLGFYAGRLFRLFAASVLPVVLLVEAGRIAGLLDAAIALADERSAALARSREQLARAQQLEAIGQLTGGIAHDFNNLLTVVIGNLELIAGARGDGEKVARLAQSAIKAAERGEHLVRQLLTYARRQIGHPQTVDLNRVIADGDSLIRRVIGERIELVALASPHPAMVRIDPAQFETALLNLVINARDAMATGGRITIETRHVVVGSREAVADPETMPGPYVMVEVSDRGVGMTPEVLARAFDPFFTTKEVGKGSGLGLSQVYGFARTAGGHVRIRSEPGRGTTVGLFLPPSSEPSAPPRPPEPASLPPARGDETILLVEDDEEVLAVTAECLRGLGYRVVTAGDAAAALAILGGGQPVDLLFSDVVIPGGTNGAELALVARRLRPGLKVLLALGYSAAALRLEPGLPDHFEVVDKPFQRDELARKLRAAIAG